MMWIVDHAQIVFNSDSFLNVQLETLVYLLQNDDMEIEEDDVWRAVLRWGLLRRYCLVFWIVIACPDLLHCLF